MPVSAKALFLCTKCDAQSAKWSGRCLECGAWSTITEIASVPEEKKAVMQNGRPGKTFSLSELKGKKTAHRPTGIAEFDRVLGGGIVPGALVLLSGEPGIGKSTLLLQVASALPGVLYASGEETADQVALRFERLVLSAPRLTFLSETDVETNLETIDSEAP